MNTTNIMKLVACLTWAGAAISSATTADAYAATGQSGAYAACSAESMPYTDIGKVCSGAFYFSYMQKIKFLSTSCNTGGCWSDLGNVYVEAVYPTGRKVTSVVSTCVGTATRVYTLDFCSC
jgi:hypothetical protein